jgi:hypothetical protein
MTSKHTHYPLLYRGIRAAWEDSGVASAVLTGWEAD